MPELREVLAHHFVISSFIEPEAVGNGADMKAMGLWADATAKELKYAKDGHVFRFNPAANHHKIKRGSKNGQTQLFPPQFSITKENPTPDKIEETLALTGAKHTFRAAVLNFGPIGLKVSISFQLITNHYNANIYESVI